MSVLFIGQSVLCLGNVQCKVKEIRAWDDCIITEPTNWLLANQKPPVFFMNRKDVFPSYKVDDMISCSFGKGQIKQIREDGVFVVTLANWELANGKSPVLYLQESSITKYSPELVVPEAAKGKNYVEECIEKATKYKNEATDFYKAGDMLSARGKYLEALGAMHYLQADLSNAEKANVFELGLLLISAIEEKISSGTSEVWKCLQANGLTLDKLMEWKRKSLFYMGKAELKNKDFEDAVTHLEAALAMKANAKDVAVLKDLLETAKKYRAAELKKEKSTWSKAFQSLKESSNEPESVTASSSAPNSPAKQASSAPAAAGASASSATSTTANLSKSGDKVHIDMNSILGKDASKPSDAIAKKDDTIFNMIFGLGFLGIVGSMFWMFRARFHRR